MLPARSQATSDGWLKLDPGVPAPRPRPAGARPRCSGRAAPPRGPAPAGAPPAACGGPHRDHFRLSAEHERDAPVGIELHDLTRSLVDRPDVVLRIDAQTNRRIEAVHVLSQLAHELAGRIELEQPRSAVRERAVVAERRVRMSRARVDENLSLRIRADAADRTEKDVGGRLQEVDGVERGSVPAARQAVRREGDRARSPSPVPARPD